MVQSPFPSKPQVMQCISLVAGQQQKGAGFAKIDKISHVQRTCKAYRLWLMVDALHLCAIAMIALMQWASQMQMVQEHIHHDVVIIIALSGCAAAGVRQC